MYINNMKKTYEFARNERKLLPAEIKYSDVKADFGTNFGFLMTKLTLS